MWAQAKAGETAAQFRYTLRDSRQRSGFATDFAHTLMPLLRLETPQETSTPAIRAALESSRDQFVRDNAIDFSNEANLCPRLPNELPFFALPEQQLLAYEKHRETSELGHIFRIANGSHDFIDALAVVGSGGGFLGAKALAAACCDPYHNELTRAARGSKPRIYFADHAMDNDHFQSLIGRLHAGGYGDTPAEKSWAVIAIDRAVDSETASTHDPGYVLDHLITLLNRMDASTTDASRGIERTELASRLVTSIGPTEGDLSKRLSGQGFVQALQVPKNLGGPFGLLTPVGLLSSAFLGLDCIQLLVGAAAINENFRNQPYETNLVLRFVASTLESHQLYAWWTRSLQDFMPWMKSFQSETSSFDVAIGPGDFELTEQLQIGRREGRELVCNHVSVDAIRTDPLAVQALADGNSPGTALVVNDFQQRAVEVTDEMLLDFRIRQNRIVLPVIDTHSLGQFIQLMMLSEAIKRETGV